MTEKKSPKKKYYLFNSEKFILGRMSVKIAFMLQGKNKPQFAPNKAGDCNVIVINSDKLNVSGKKMGDKMYHTFSGYPGGITSRNLEEMIKKDSRKAIWNAVYGMLPKNKLRNPMMKKMLIFKDDKYNMPNIEIEEVQPQKA